MHRREATATIPFTHLPVKDIILIFSLFGDGARLVNFNKNTVFLAVLVVHNLLGQICAGIIFNPSTCFLAILDLTLNGAVVARSRKLSIRRFLDIDRFDGLCKHRQGKQSHCNDNQSFTHIHLFLKSVQNYKKPYKPYQNSCKFLKNQIFFAFLKSKTDAL